MIIDHICFAVKDLNDGISYWKNVFGYDQMTADYYKFASKSQGHIFT